MMVEDEFYAVAQTFTQHMHYAEYVRRTKEAKAQNAARIQDIARPTDGVSSLSEETRKKKEAEALAVRQKEGLGQLEDGNGGDAEKSGGLERGEEEEDVLLQDDSWAGTSLYDLMMSPRKARSLVGSRGIKSSTRAAAGYVQTSQQSGSSAAGAPPSSPSGRAREQVTVFDETASEDDDDLDVQPGSTFKRTLEDIKAHKTEKSEPTKPSIAPTKYVSYEPVKTTQPKATPSSISARSINYPTIPQPRKRMLFDDGFDRLPEPEPNDVSMQDTPAKRDPPPQSSSSSSTGNKQSPNNLGGVDNNPKLESKRSRLNEVPTFLL